MEITVNARVEQPLFDFDPETIEAVVDQVTEALLAINSNGSVSADLETGTLDVELVVWSTNLADGFKLATQQVYAAMESGGLTWHFDNKTVGEPPTDQFAWSIERTDTQNAELIPA